MPSEVARHRLEFLVDDGGLLLPVTQWPLPSGAVITALERLETGGRPALEEAREAVLAEIRSSEAARATLVIRNPQEALPGYGDIATPGSAASVKLAAFQGDWLAGRLGAGVERGAAADRGPALRFEDSALATEALGLQLQAWSHRSWWGPGWQSSLILGNNAAAINAIGFQRAAATRSDNPLLAWVGPWNFEFFVGRLDGTSAPAHPNLIGNRLTLRPLPWLELGVTRTAQWGGQGRPQTLRSFLNALTGSGLNADTPQQTLADPANELAGFDLRARCPHVFRCAAYVQLIGEDQAGLLPSHYLGLYGLEMWSADGGDRWFAEYVESGCRTPIGRPPLKGCAYRNYAFHDGYTQDGRWLGASVGPDSRLLTLGWLHVGSETSIRLHYGFIGSRPGSFSSTVDDPVTSGHAFGSSAKTAFHWRGAVIEPELSVLRIAAPHGIRYEPRLGVSLSAAIDRLH